MWGGIDPMRNTFRDLMAAGIAVILLGAMSAAGQTGAYKAPRGPDGHPDLNGIWQALNTADWDLEGHAAQASQVVEMGTHGGEPGGSGAVEGVKVPYLS